MRCTCCNRILNDFESTRKHQVTGEYLDMCNKCFSFCGNIPVIERDDLKRTEEVYEDMDEVEYESGDWDDDLSEVQGEGT